MAVSHSDLVRRAYDALNAGDLEAALAPLAPDAEWHESPALPESGVFAGRETIGAFLGHFLESWEHFRQEIEDVETAGDKVAVFLHLHARGRESGIEVDRRYAHVWTIRDGVAVRVDAYDDPDDARAALAPDAAAPQAPAATTETRNSR